MITRNIYSRHVFNGMGGHVISISRSPDQVTVKLDCGRIVTLERETFSFHNRETSTVIATRKQIPLRLSYAVTGE